MVRTVLIVVATLWVAACTKLIWLQEAKEGSDRPTKVYGIPLHTKVNIDGALSNASSARDTKITDGPSSLIQFKEFLAGKFLKSANATQRDSPSNLSRRAIVSSDEEKRRDGKAVEIAGKLTFFERLGCEIESVGKPWKCDAEN